MESNGVELAVELEPTPVMVNGDPARLQQIQVNLLNNAAKYTPRGGHVTLRVGRDGDEAIVRVRDDGAGIPPEMLESVFELFVQAGATLDRAAGGLGVGLTLVRSLVSMHGGTVTARSDGLGTGTEVVVRFPACDEAAPSSGPRREPRAGRGLKVVVIEDNDDARQMLSTFLGGAGFECRTAATGVAGLALFDEWRPDVAIIDIGLPEMDGLEVARRVRRAAENSGAYLVALSGYGQVADSAAAHAAGFDCYMVKPVDLDHLVAELSGG